MSRKLLAKLALIPQPSSSKNLGILAIAAFIAIANILNACSVTSTPTTSPVATASPNKNKNESLLLVVATSTVICDLTKQIAGDTIALKCLIEAGTDPHLYQPKPEDRKAIDSASLILYGGYDFEPSLIKLIQSSSSTAQKIAINEIAVPSPLVAQKENDPHVWNNAQNGIKIVQSISKSLIALRPDQAETYAKNTSKLVNELGQIDIWIKSQIATIPESSRKLVTTHDALGYYAQAYNIPIEGALNGISTEEQPTPARVKELVEVIKSSKVPTIFAEVSINPKLITTVAKEANVKVSERELYADGLGARGTEAETYTGMLIANTRTIVEGLGGKYIPFQIQK